MNKWVRVFDIQSIKLFLTKCTVQGVHKVFQQLKNTAKTSILIIWLNLLQVLIAYRRFWSCCICVFQISCWWNTVTSLKRNMKWTPIELLQPYFIKTTRYQILNKGKEQHWFNWKTIDAIFTTDGTVLQRIRQGVNYPLEEHRAINGAKWRSIIWAMMQYVLII